MDTHFVFAGDYYYRYNTDDIYYRKDSLILLNKMKEYNITKVMVTYMVRRRYNLITKEKMEKYCKGEEYEKESVNDDLDVLFECIRLGKEPDETVNTYFLPMLTKKEVELIEQEDYNYLKTFRRPNPDVKKAEMKLSQSNSKFVYSWGVRRTVTIDLNFWIRNDFSQINQESASKIVATQNN